MVLEVARVLRFPGAGSSVLMIFTSSVAGAASVGGAIVGLVITGFGAAGLLEVRRVVCFFLVWASAALRPQLTTNKAATNKFK